VQKEDTITIRHSPVGHNRSVTSSREHSPHSVVLGILESPFLSSVHCCTDQRISPRPLSSHQPPSMPHPTSSRRVSCSCKEDAPAQHEGSPKYCSHGWLLYGLATKARNCRCLHEDIVEGGNPANRDWADSSWTYVGSNVKTILDEARKQPPSYCSHGKCIYGSE
jgi:hypothetical protein